MNNTNVEYGFDYSFHMSVAVTIAIILLTVAILGSSRCQRKERSKRPVCYDCKTQTLYTYTLTSNWKPPRVVPVTTWKLFANQPEVHRFERGVDPFYSQPVAEGGRFENPQQSQTNAQQASGLPLVGVSTVPSWIPRLELEVDLPPTQST